MADTPLTVVMTRHAERVATGADPGLSAAGRARASLLARMLVDADVVGVYATATRRSQQTAAPTATRAGVAVTTYDALAAQALAATITGAHVSGTVVVVAHSNTVDDIATALGLTGVGELSETQFDRLLVITWRPTGATGLRLCYGTATP